MISALRYSGILFLLLAASMLVQWTALNAAGKPTEFLTLVPFYIMNYAMGVIIVSTLIYLSKKKGEVLGFVFMGGSLVKFAVFFVVFYPELHENEASKKATFVLFFIPYAITVIAEVWYLIRFLNKQD